MFVVLDIETDDLDAKTIWCIVCQDVATGEQVEFREPSGNPEVARGFLSYMANATALIGHNIIGFDLPVLHRLLGMEFNPNKVIDTLVVSQLLNYNIPGGHSLDAWGERLKFPKTKFNDFSKFSEEMLAYCKQDVRVSAKLFELFKPYIESADWRKSLRLEHDIAWLCNDLNKTGFGFDYDTAQKIHSEILSQVQVLENELQTAFPPRSKLIREITPVATKHGTLHQKDFRWLKDGDLTAFRPGVPFSLINFEPFNPGSPKQCVERLNDAGWRPYEKTKGHIQAERDRDSEKLKHFQIYGWSISENNLATLPDTAPPAAKKLVQWLLLDSRRSTLEEWFNAYNPTTKSIHGRFRHIGAWTGRMSHSAPNMANIPSGGSLYGDEFRKLWTARGDGYLVGVDADAIQLRVLAHYMDDERFTAALVSGSKDTGTDAHTLNQRALGAVCRSRDVAKTFIYAFLLGAGVGKIAQILDCSSGDAREAVDNFISYYPGLQALREDRIPADASRGYFLGLDGRKVVQDNAHLMLAGYLQNGEAVIMKTANLLWQRQAKAEGLKFKQVNFVHDEWQTEVFDLTTADRIGILKVQSIEKAGELLNMRCPLAGNSIIGRNWLETH